MPPQILRYKIEPQPLGRGGMATVYLAEDRITKGQVAIKVLHPHIVPDHRSAETFFKEAMAGALMGQRSPHIVRVDNYGFEDNTTFLAMEYLKGGNIVPRLGAVTGTEAKTIMTHVCAGVKVAHDNKIVHSDLSPDNILHDVKKNVYKVSDFGFLKILESVLLSRGQSVFTGGKPYYMPPAHFHNPNLIDYSTDIYALGIIYYHLLTGSMLFAIFPNLPVVPGQVKIKKNGVNLHANGLTFIKNCITNTYKNIDQVVQGIVAVPNQN